MFLNRAPRNNTHCDNVCYFIEFNEYGDQELNLLNYELFHCSVTCYCFLYALNFRSQTFITFGQIIRYVKTAKYFI